MTTRAPVPQPSADDWRVDLFARWPWLKRLVRMRSFQFLVVLPNLAFFYLFFIAGVLGTPVGNRNILIVFVWILWWFLLIAVMVPFLSRVWCTMCPLPFFGDWLQRGALIGVRSGTSAGSRNRFRGLNRPWPARLRNIWVQNAGFLLLATFSAPLVTRPMASVVVFGVCVVLATGLALVYQHRAFCMYVCPISGFLSLYSMTSMVELRSRDRGWCRDCRTKSCLRGNDRGWACPWHVYMGTLDRNNYCGLCFECVKSCPDDNVALYARPFVTSEVQLRGYDEVWKATIMLGLALTYSALLQGPWRELKDWANVSESGNWAGFLTFALGQAVLATVALPALFFAAVVAGKRLARADGIPTRTLFVGYACMFVPMGLFAWIAFSLPLVLINGSYILAVASDPLGWGMDLFGTADFHWTPVWADKVPLLQAPLMLAGLGYGLAGARRVATHLVADPRQRWLTLVPPALLLLAIQLVFLTLFIG